VSVIPPGTTLRAFYVTQQGDAFVDLSPNVTTGHPGGSYTELLTVHAIVNAVTANLPTVQRVQILVDGKEADTLAGHVDLRRPLSRDASFVRPAADGQ
jgi:spore germination protein GerM